MVECYQLGQSRGALCGGEIGYPDDLVYLDSFFKQRDDAFSLLLISCIEQTSIIARIIDVGPGQALVGVIPPPLAGEGGRRSRRVGACINNPTRPLRYRSRPPSPPEVGCFRLRHVQYTSRVNPTCGGEGLN